MSKTNSTTLNALRTLFGARADRWAVARRAASTAPIFTGGDAALADTPLPYRAAADGFAGGNADAVGAGSAEHAVHQRAIEPLGTKSLRAPATCSYRVATDSHRPCTIVSVKRFSFKRYMVA